ncbi:b(0,+)-type amino acid transporter 1 [Hydra vulgaris]|nr:b(0,+)-type amino acid transporter 1 [Hydra vulgaris]
MSSSNDIPLSNILNSNGNLASSSDPICKDSINPKHKVGLLGCVSLIVGTMIGSGIFASTSSVFINSGSPGMALIIWTGSGVLVALISLCYVELGTMIQLSGGEYSYYLEAFGELPAFLLVYASTFFLRPASLAAILLASGSYMVEPFFSDGCNLEEKQLISKYLAAFFLGVIIVINCASTRWATTIQIVFTAAKLLAIAILVITGLVRLAQGYNSEFQNSFNGTKTHLSSIGYAFYGGLWAYDGWNNLNFVTEDLKNPTRNLPLAIIIGIPLVTGCYALINVAYLTVLTSAEIANSSAVAVTLANRVYGKYSFIIPIFVSLSTFGSANGIAFTSGRLVFVAARKKHLPQALAMIHYEQQTPVPALALICILAWVMMIPESSNFTTLINYFNFAAWIFYSLSIIALLWMRYKKPDIKRPFKIFIGIPVIVLLVSIYLVVAPFSEKPLESTYCLLVILTGIPLYFAFVKYKILAPSLMKLFDKLTRSMQLLANLYLPYNTSEENTKF